MEKNEPPKEWTITTTVDRFKSTSSASINPTDKLYSTFVPAFIGKLNHCSVDSGDIQVYPFEYIPDTDTITIKSEGNDEMHQISEFIHYEHDCYFLDINLQIIQA